MYVIRYGRHVEDLEGQVNAGNKMNGPIGTVLGSQNLFTKETINMEDEIKELKSVLRSLVVSSPTQVDVRTLMRDYRSMVGKPVPIAKYGYKEFVMFLRERCSDCFLLHGDPRNPVLTLIVPETLKHIDKFVQKQKVSNTLKHKGKRRSVVAPVLLPSNNLISETFFAKQKEKSENTTTNHERSQEYSELDVVQKANVSKENKIKQVHNGTSQSALENFMKKRMPLCNSSQSFETEKSQNDTNSSKGDGDSGRQTFSSSSSTKWTQFEELKTEIKNILEDHPEGIWCTDLITLYRERHGRELQVARFGFTSVLSLACALEDTVRAWRPRGAADWRLLHPAAAVPQPPTHAPPPAPAAHCNRPAHIDPDDALPGVDYDPDVFPEDCLHFMDSIPLPSLTDLEVGAHVEVIVGEVYSPSHFWLIRLGQQHSVAMEDIMDEMTKYYERGEGRERRLARGAVRVGQYCSSCYEGDWHRSLIVKIVDSDTVKVRHVDYGTVERCAVTGLRPLLRHWGALPQQAIRARLAAVRPPDGGRRWPRAAAAYLLRAVTQRQLVALLSAHHEDILEVLLIDTTSDEDVCINTEMIRAGYADPRSDSCLGTSECYLCPSFDALETGDTPNYAEIQCYLRDGIVLDFVEDYRRHVPPCLPGLVHPPLPPFCLSDPSRPPLPGPVNAALSGPVPSSPPPTAPPSDRAEQSPALSQNHSPLVSNKAETPTPKSRIPQLATVLPLPSSRVPHQPAQPRAADLYPVHVSVQYDPPPLEPPRSDSTQQRCSPHRPAQYYKSSSPTIPFRELSDFSFRQAQNVPYQQSMQSTNVIRADQAPAQIPTPQMQPNLSAAENEIFYHLRQASAAHMYMMEALQRAIAATSLAGAETRLNPEAAKFHATAVRYQTEAPPAPAAPLASQTSSATLARRTSPASQAHPAPGDNLISFDNNAGRQSTVNPAVKRFFENVAPSASIAPPPGFEHLYRRF